MAAPRPTSPGLRERGVVIDASVLLKLLLPEAQSDAVRRLWGKWVEEDTQITAPFLLAYEVTSVLRNKVFRGELPSEAGEAAFLAFRTQEVFLLHPEGIEEKTWGLARQWNLPTSYDAAYLALAELMDYELWTADRRFAVVFRKKVPRLRVISSRPS